jgi:hypothetical protein
MVITLRTHVHVRKDFLSPLKNSCPGSWDSLPFTGEAAEGLSVAEGADPAPMACQAQGQQTQFPASTQ